MSDAASKSSLRQREVEARQRFRLFNHILIRLLIFVQLSTAHQDVQISPRLVAVVVYFVSA